MLLMAKTRILGSFERAVTASDLPSMFEGAALRTTLNTSTGVAEVSRSGSGTGDFFAGVAMNPARFPTLTSRVESITVPASSAYVVTLTGLANSNTDIGGVRASDGTVYVHAGSPVAGTSFTVGSATDSFGVVRTTLTFASGDAGLVFVINYRHVLSGAQAAALLGDQYQRMTPDYTGTVSYITHGEVWTDAFDPTCAWTSPAVKMTTGGLFSHTSSSRTGTALTRATVIQAPTVDAPYLGLLLA